MLSVLVQPAVDYLSDGPDLAVIFIGAFIIAYIYYYNVCDWFQPETVTQSGRLPPSLKSLPIIGSLPYLPGFETLHKFFLEKLPTMGPVIRFSMMSRNSIILQTREAIAEAFTKAEISNHPTPFIEDLLERPKKGIINLEYAGDFKKFHQLTLTILKQFGFGKLGGVMETRIQCEVTEMIAQFRASESQLIVPSNIVDVAVINVIASILFGKRYERDDTQVREFLRNNCQLFKASMKIVPLAHIPAFRYIPYYRRALDDTKTVILWYDEVLEQIIDECLRGETDSPCFVRSFIEAEGSETYDKMQLIGTLQDLLMAGSETSASAIKWSIFLLANHQDIQTRLQTAIDDVVPRERLPSLGDRLRLTIVEAFIMELMRFKTIIPLGLAHETSKDAVVKGFFLPANTLVIPNLYAVHMDPNIWGDPETFRPDRFIDEAGNIINREKLIPFSIGKRSCVGEQLARQEIFLFLAGLLQNFTVLPPEGCRTVVCEEIFATTLSPSLYAVRFMPRDCARSAAIN